MVLRSALLEQVTKNLRSHGVPQTALALDGFFSFGARELDLLVELAKHTRVSLTLPDWPGAAANRRRLDGRPASRSAAATSSRPPNQRALSWFRGTIDQEADEISRRILGTHRTGVAFGQMGVVVRGPGPHLEALRTSLHRFGIPSRFYFTQKVASHSAVRFFSGVMRAMFGGWKWEDVLASLRINASGLAATPDGDAIDFALRERMPGTGLAGLRDLLPAAVLAAFESIERWAGTVHSASGWARRIGVELPALFPLGPIQPGSMLDVELARAHARSARVIS